MFYRVLADLALLAHLAFVVYALFGGLLALRRPRAIWPHAAALAWGVFAQFANKPCPLTPLENHFRRMGGEAGYEGGFIEHYVAAALYPENLTVELRVALGLVLLAVNVLVYSYLYARGRRGAKA